MNLDMAEAMDEYATTPAEAVRNAIMTERFSITGDAERCADAIIAAADAEQPSQRLVLGSVAYDNIERTLAERLTALRSQKSIATAADRSN